MIFLFPLGRQTKLATFPYATLALIVLTTAVFFNTWPPQKKYWMARLPGAPLHQAAQRFPFARVEREVAHRKLQSSGSSA